MEIEKVNWDGFMYGIDQMQMLRAVKIKLDEVIEIINKTNCLQSIPTVLNYKLDIKDSTK